MHSIVTQELWGSEAGPAWSGHTALTDCTKYFNSLAKNDPSNDNWAILRAVLDVETVTYTDLTQHGRDPGQLAVTGTWLLRALCSDQQRPGGWDSHYQGIRART